MSSELFRKTINAERIDVPEWVSEAQYIFHLVAAYNKDNICFKLCRDDEHRMVVLNDIVRRYQFAAANAITSTITPEELKTIEQLILTKTDIKNASNDHAKTYAIARTIAHIMEGPSQISLLYMSKVPKSTSVAQMLTMSVFSSCQLANLVHTNNSTPKALMHIHFLQQQTEVQIEHNNKNYEPKLRHHKDIDAYIDNIIKDRVQDIHTISEQTEHILNFHIEYDEFARVIGNEVARKRFAEEQLKKKGVSGATVKPVFVGGSRH